MAGRVPTPPSQKCFVNLSYNHERQTSGLAGLHPLFSVVFVLTVKEFLESQTEASKEADLREHPRTEKKSKQAQDSMMT